MSGLGGREKIVADDEMLLGSRRSRQSFPRSLLQWKFDKTFQNLLILNTKGNDTSASTCTHYPSSYVTQSTKAKKNGRKVIDNRNTTSFCEGYSVHRKVFVDKQFLVTAE